MEQIIGQILTILRGAWRYRWWGVLVAWLVATVGWVAVQTVPDTFEARTQVYVDTQSVLQPLLEGLAVDRDIGGQVAMMQSVMLSRPNLEKVAKKTDLLVSAKSRTEEEAIVDALADRVQLSTFTGGRGARAATNRFVVTFEDSDPNRAFKVVQAVLDTFMEDTLGLKRTDSDVAQRFLRSQLADYETRLFEAEQRLAAFKQQNVGLLPGGSRGDYYTRLEAEMATLQQMQSRQRQLTERRNELQRQLEGEEPTYGLMGSADGSPIDQQIAGFQAQIDELLLKYTDRHPQIAALKETIARLEKEKLQGAKISPSVAPPGAGISSDEALVRSLDMNPVYQNLRLALSQADADLAELRGQLGAQQAQVADLRSKVEAVPEIEAELTRLSRDYDVNKAQYETLLKRLESAKISEQADASSDTVKFRVIEPPFKPLAPVGPNRPLMSTVVLLAALLFGAAFAVFMAQIRPTFSTRDTLQSITGLPVLGSVSAAIVRSIAPWYRQQPFMVSSAIGLLLVVFLLNLVLADNIRHAILRIVG